PPPDSPCRSYSMIPRDCHDIRRFSINEDAALHCLPSHYGAGHLRRLSWGRGIRRHAPVLWLSVAVLVLSMSWMKACTYGHSRLTGAIASALWHRHATDESLP